MMRNRQGMQLARNVGVILTGLLLSTCGPTSQLTPPGAVSVGGTGSTGTEGVEWVEWVYSKPAGVEFTRTEVTLGQFKKCVLTGACKEKNRKTKSDNKYCNWGYSDRENHPMNCVDWYGARDFCAWAGGRLPTEDEWYAEASNGGSREWPWGDNPEVNCECDQKGDSDTDGYGKDRTWPVCSKTEGNSVSGLCDMSGNVWEWTSSKYKLESDDMVLCGGSWGDDRPDSLRASLRNWYSPALGDVYYGFRCVRSLPGQQFFHLADLLGIDLIE